MATVCASAAAAVTDARDGASPAVGGFGLSGVPEVLIQALHAQGATALKIVSTTAGSMAGAWEHCWPTGASRA